MEDDFKLTGAHLKPGFLVSSKVNKILENGFELTFLGGITGTVFQDHIDPSLKDLKVGSKLNARIISINQISKRLTLSTLPHLVDWSPDSKNTTTLPKVGESFDNVKIKNTLFGSSYQVDLGKGKLAFLHKTHSRKEEPVEEDVEMADDDELPEPKKLEDIHPMLQVGETISYVKIKEINYFDLMPLLSVKDTVVGQANLNY